MSHSLDYQILIVNFMISSSFIHQYLLDMLKLISFELLIPGHHHCRLRITQLFVLLGELQQLFC